MKADHSRMFQNLAQENEIANLNSIRIEMVEKEEFFRVQQETAAANEKVNSCHSAYLYVRACTFACVHVLVPWNQMN